MIVQIFVENAIKHGLKPLDGDGTRQLELMVRVSQQAGGDTLIEVVDNGNGMNSGRNSQGRTGLQVVRQTVQMFNEVNHGRIDYGVQNRTDGTGCRSWLLLPAGFVGQLAGQK